MSRPSSITGSLALGSAGGAIGCGGLLGDRRAGGARRGAGRRGAWSRSMSRRCVRASCRRQLWWWSWRRCVVAAIVVTVVVAAWAVASSSEPRTRRQQQRRRRPGRRRRRPGVSATVLAYQHCAPSCQVIIDRDRRLLDLRRARRRRCRPGCRCRGSWHRRGGSRPGSPASAASTRSAWCGRYCGKAPIQRVIDTLGRLRSHPEVVGQLAEHGIGHGLVVEVGDGADRRGRATRAGSAIRRRDASAPTSASRTTRRSRTADATSARDSRCAPVRHRSAGDRRRSRRRTMITSACSNSASRRRRRGLRRRAAHRCVRAGVAITTASKRSPSTAIHAPSRSIAVAARPVTDTSAATDDVAFGGVDERGHPGPWGVEDRSGRRSPTPVAAARARRPATGCGGAPRAATSCGTAARLE